jgi:predicted CXXCH cytochrome family protein
MKIRRTSWKRVSTRVLSTVVVHLITLGAMRVAAAELTSPLPCAECHRPNTTAETGADVPTALCLRCHSEIDKSLSHPIGVQPRQSTVPGSFPLSSRGLLTCATCHDAHAAHSLDKVNLRHGVRGGFAGQAFCGQCHRDSLKAPGHSHRSLGQAHFIADDPGASPDGLADGVSRRCLACHDGSMGSMSSAGSLGREAGEHHPIGTVYDSSPGRLRSFRARFTLDSRIKLFEGKVGCPSCHVSHTTRPKLLVMDNTASRLCLGCHIK